MLPVCIPGPFSFFPPSLLSPPHTATSSHKLGETKHEMDTISSNVKVSHGLISKFERREITDKLLIFFGLVLFFGVVLYILKKRLLGWIW